MAGLVGYRQAPALYDKYFPPAADDDDDRATGAAAAAPLDDPLLAPDKRGDRR